MTRAYVGLGSNIDPERNIRTAVRLLARRCRVVGLSTLYRTQAVPAGSPDFIDGVVAIETSLPALALKFGILRDIERQLGRARSSDRNAPRTIDCDLLLLGDTIIDEQDLVLPSPDVSDRPFVARPLLELDPSLVLPGSGFKLADAASRMASHPMSPLPDFTSSLRKELEEMRDGPRTHREARSRVAR